MHIPGCNVGGSDRLERVAHGVVFMLIGIFLVSGPWSVIITAYGAIRLMTGLFAFCPVYLPFRYTTAPAKKTAARNGPGGPGR